MSGSSREVWTSPMSCPQDWWTVGVRRLLIRTGGASEAQRYWSWYGGAGSE